MGNPKQKWTSEEEEALRAGVKKHGIGKWKNIQRDPEFSHLLSSRSNIDLKVLVYVFPFIYFIQLTIVVVVGVCFWFEGKFPKKKPGVWMKFKK